MIVDARCTYTEDRVAGVTLKKCTIFFFFFLALQCRRGRAGSVVLGIQIRVHPRCWSTFFFSGRPCPSWRKMFDMCCCDLGLSPSYAISSISRPCGRYHFRSLDYLPRRVAFWPLQPLPRFLVGTRVRYYSADTVQHKTRLSTFPTFFFVSAKFQFFFLLLSTSTRIEMIC